MRVRASVCVCTCVHVCIVGLGVLSECVQPLPVHLTSNVRHCCTVYIPPIATLVGNLIVGVSVHVCVVSRWMLACIIIGGCTGCGCLGVSVAMWAFRFGHGCIRFGCGCECIIQVDMLACISIGLSGCGCWGVCGCG